MVLSHCPRALEHQLKNSSKWEETESNQDVVDLLKMIRNITHNKKATKKSVMTIVESDVKLFTIHIGSGETLDEYYKVLRPRLIPSTRTEATPGTTPWSTLYTWRLF